LQEPNISSPSICVILTVQVEPKEYFKIAFTSCFGSPYWVVLCKNRSLLSSPQPGRPPCLKW
jgi:hypothetical protein